MKMMSLVKRASKGVHKNGQLTYWLKSGVPGKRDHKALKGRKCCQHRGGENGGKKGMNYLQFLGEEGAAA